MKNARLALAVILLLSVTGTVLGIAPSEQEGPYDHLTLPRIGAAIGVRATDTDTLAEDDPVRIGWVGFQEEVGGKWSVWIEKRSGFPTLVEGTGLRWFDPAGPEPTEKELAAKARALVEAHPDLLGQWGGQMVLDPDASGPWQGDVRQVTFRQEVGGVRVEHARYDFYVSHGNLVSFGAHRWSRVRRSVEPSIGVDEARAAVRAYLGVEEVGEMLEREPAVLRLIPVDPRRERQTAWTGERSHGLEHMLVWRLRLELADDRGDWIALVDADTGRVVSFWNDLAAAEIQGGVYPLSSDGVGWDGTEQPGFPMPFAAYGEDGNWTQWANDHGLYQCNAGSQIEADLRGPYVSILTSCGLSVEQGTCGDILDFGSGPGEDCSYPVGHGYGDTHAARTTFYHVNRAKEVGRYWLPDNEWVRGHIPVEVDFDGGECNAWGAAGSLTFMRSMSSCRNTGELAGVIYHEFGHGLNYSDGGGVDHPDEAYADIVSLFGTRDSCIGRGYYRSQDCGGCLDCSGIRDQDWAQRTEATPRDRAWVQTHCAAGDEPCGGERYCEAGILAQTVWDLAFRDLPAQYGLDEASAWQIAEGIFYRSRPGSGGDAYNCSAVSSDGCSTDAWFHRFRVADDNDGNLANGTPHAAAIFAAFDRHGIACNSADSPSNLTSGLCSLAAPEITVIDYGTGAYSVKWHQDVPGATSYRILRNDLGCSAQQVVIDTIDAPDTTFVDHYVAEGVQAFYRVQPAAPGCETVVSNCTSQAADVDGDDWSANEDCDDLDPAQHPHATEICNLEDDDCDGTIDEGFPQYTFYRDADGDTYGNPYQTTSWCYTVPPGGYVGNSADCNDADPTSHPGATEVCDGNDNNCDSVLPPDEADRDSDGYVECDAWSDTQGDDPQIQGGQDPDDFDSSSFPGAVEICDARDNDGDGLYDEGCDRNCDNPETAAETRLTDAVSHSRYPSVSFAETEFGAAWHDLRDGQPEIYFARTDRLGTKLGADVRVTATGNAFYPSIAWNGSYYGLAWQDEVAGSDEIWFTLLDRLGNPLGSNVRVTTATGNSRYASLVWAGSAYGLVWSDRRDGNEEIYFARLDPLGNKVGSDVRVTNATGTSTRPKLVWTGSEYAVAWLDSRSGNSSVYFARLDPTGIKLGSDLIVAAGGNPTEPSLAWNGAAYGIGWSDDRYGNQEIFFARIDRYGNKIGSDLRLTIDPGTSADCHVATTGSAFGVAWNDDRHGTYEIYFAQVDSAGNKAGGDTRVTSVADPSRQPFLVWSGDEFAVAWSDDRDGNGEIYFARMRCCDDADADGYTECEEGNDASAAIHPGALEVCNGIADSGNTWPDDVCDGACDNAANWSSDVRITLAEPDDSYWPSIVWTGNTYGMAWTDDRDGNDEIYFARTGPLGQKLGPDVRVTTVSGSSVDPSLVWTGSDYGVAWVDERDGAHEIYFARLNADGVKIGSDRRVTQESEPAARPALVWTGSEYGLAWQDYRMGAWTVYFVRLDRFGNRIGSELQISNHEDGAESPALVWNGDGYGLAWQDERLGDPYVYFALLDRTGAKIGDDVWVTREISGLPSLAWTSRHYGLAFADARSGDVQVWFVRLDETGVPTGPEVRLDSGTVEAIDPVVVFNGTEYGVTWSDRRHGSPQLYFARVDSDGLAVGTDVRFSYYPSSQESPSLVWNGTEFGVVWQDNRHGGVEIYFGRLSCCDDRDGDGYTECANDANDADGSVHPLAPELCDAKDNDGNGVVDDGCDTICDNPEKVGDDLRFTDLAGNSWWPDLVWADGQYGLSWSDNGEGDYIVWFGRLTATGSKTGLDHGVPFPYGNSQVSSMVWTGAEYGIAWRDDRDGDWDLYFARLDAGGSRVGSDIQLTMGPAMSADPSLVWNGSGYGVAWEDDRDGNLEAYFARLEPSGRRIGDEVRVTDAASDSAEVSLVWTGSGYGLAWNDLRDGNYEIYFVRLDAMGNRIGAETRVTNDAASSRNPTLVWTGYEYALAWQDTRDGNSEIYFARLDSIGVQIGGDLRITDASGGSYRPELVWTGGEYGLTWYDNRLGYFEAMFVQLDPTGIKKNDDGNATENPSASTYPSLVWTGSEYALAWQDDRDGNPEIYFLHARCCDDNDLDTFTECDNDCDDGNPLAYPDAPEICDYADNDCDGTVDEGFVTPGITGNLGFAADKQTLQWSAEPVADYYDVIRGDLMTLRSTGGAFDLSLDTCMENDDTNTQAVDATDPAAGQGFYYLVRAQTDCRHGTYDSGDPSQSGERDTEIEAWGGHCP